MRLHHAMEKFEKKAETLNIETCKNPITETQLLLDEEWPASSNSKRQKSRIKSLNESSDDFPMHIVMLRHDFMSKICHTNIDPIGHVKLMRVAGKTEMVYLDELVIRKVSRKLIAIPQFSL